MAAYLVKFDFVAEQDSDLPLVSGETIILLEKDETGWWKGRNELELEGYFPSTYVEPKKPTLPPRPNAGRKLPPTPPATATAATSSKNDKDDEDDEGDEDSEDDEDKDDGESGDDELLPPSGTSAGGGARPMSMYGTPLVNGHLDFETSTQMGEEFSLSSLDAFDQLMNDGFSVEMGTSTGGGGEQVTTGSRVTVQCKAKTWDGAATVAHQFSTGELTFNVGAGQVSRALDKALLQFKKGDAGTVTAAPQMCYGAAGLPPFVPPHSHIVYALEVTNVAATSIAVEPEAAVGPLELLKIFSVGKRPSYLQDDPDEFRKAVVFDAGSDEVGVAASEEGLTDEMIARAAASMDLTPETS